MRTIFWRQMCNFHRYRKSRSKNTRIARLLEAQTDKGLTRYYWEKMIVFADIGGAGALKNHLQNEQTTNKQLEDLLAKQGSLTDEEIDAQMEELEAQLRDVLLTVKEEKGKLEGINQEKANTRRAMSQQLIKLDSDASVLEQIREVMLILKGKSINCDLDFDHLCEAREEGKRIGNFSLMYDGAIKKIKKVVGVETLKRARELGLDFTKEDCVTADGEWVVVDELTTFSKKSLRSIASAIRDMIIAYDMMSVNPRAMAALSHNTEVVLNAALLLDFVSNAFTTRAKDSRRRSSKSSMKRSGSGKLRKKGSAKKLSKKKSLKKSDGDRPSRKRSMSKKKSAGKIAPKKSSRRSTSRVSRSKSTDGTVKKLVGAPRVAGVATAASRGKV